MVTWGRSEVENGTEQINPEDRDGMPVRLTQERCYRRGIEVVLTKAAPNNGLFVIVEYTDEHQTVFEADSHARARKIADVFRLRE